MLFKQRRAQNRIIKYRLSLKAERNDPDDMGYDYFDDSCFPCDFGSVQVRCEVNATLTHLHVLRR